MVATTLCVGVIGMYHSGIGGGGFMLVRDSQGGYESIDYRETAPAAATQNMYEHNQNASVYGGLAVAVPGELRGLEHLHRRYGVLPWKTLVMPAVRVARDGFRGECAQPSSTKRPLLTNTRRKSPKTWSAT
jgi:gamma-glutamyltranspeptidase/glutathione hydrolase